MTDEEALAIEDRLLREMAAIYYKANWGKEDKHVEENKTLSVGGQGDGALIVVKQLPIIEERLLSMRDYIEQITGEAVALACTEETVQAVKSKRSELSKQFEALEAQRAVVKGAVMGPYQAFEKVYKECVSEPFKTADAELKAKINEVEDEIKRRCEGDLRAYFAELCTSRGIDYLTYEQAGVKVDLTSAKARTPKKLMEQLKAFVDGVATSAAAISSMENPEEIMVEFKRTLNVAQAIAGVQQRKRAVEEEKTRAAERTEASKNTAPPSAPETFAAPKRVEKAAVERLRLTFTVEDTRDKLKLLKKFLIENSYTIIS